MRKFKLGQVVMTPGAQAALKQTDFNEVDEVSALLARHVSGDWGEVGAEDSKENDFSVVNGFRILSAYTIRSGVKVWLITENDRSVTTLLLPNEY